MTTGLAFVMAGLMADDPILESDMSYILVGILFYTGLSSMLVIRARLMPRMARNPAVRPHSLAVLGYTNADAAALSGLILAIMTGKGWLALPFGLLALISWLIVKSYLTGLAGAKNDLEFPRI
jgi:hypothetical protein